MSRLILHPSYNLYEQNGQAYCTSRQVAEEFGKALCEMELAVPRSYISPNQLDENLKFLDAAEEILSNKFDYPFLRNACREKIMRNYMYYERSHKKQKGTHLARTLDKEANV